ncbi:hypothetical protein BJY59DRAFT_697224 [Rhodotorula toruloides]
MTSYITKKVGRRLAGQNLAQYEPADPHYETYTDAKGRQKKRKRAIPAGLSKRDERILRSVRRRAHYLDKGFSLCGFRFGWTAILGLIPGAGDIAQFILGYSLVLRKCREAELPATLAQRMLFSPSSLPLLLTLSPRNPNARSLRSLAYRPTRRPRHRFNPPCRGHHNGRMEGPPLSIRSPFSSLPLPRSSSTS